MASSRQWLCCSPVPTILDIRFCKLYTHFHASISLNKMNAKAIWKIVSRQIFFSFPSIPRYGIFVCYISWLRERKKFLSWYNFSHSLGIHFVQQGPSMKLHVESTKSNFSFTLPILQFWSILKKVQLDRKINTCISSNFLSELIMF